MKGHLQGFLSFLDLMAEGSRRQADLIAGGGFDPQPRLQPVTVKADRKIPLTGHQKPDWFRTRRSSRVSTEH